MFDDFYGFSGRPFQLTPDPAFYFESLSHRKALSYLGYGLAQGEGFVVITGEVGAGKSTLVAHLMQTIDRKRLTAAQVVTSKLDGDELVHIVARAFGIRVAGQDKASALSAIEAFLYEEARNGRRCLLVIDEAQNLAIPALEELRMLSNFQLGAQPLLQIILLGQPEFRSQLQLHPSLEQLRQRVIAAHHLEAMESGEVEAYVLHRLKRVGWAGDPEFDGRVFGQLFMATAGVPRRINQIVNRVLLLGAIERKHRIDGVMLSQVLAELTGDGALTLASPAGAKPALGMGTGALHETAPLAEPTFEAEVEVAEPVVQVAPAQPTPVAPAPVAAAPIRVPARPTIHFDDDHGVPAGLDEELARRDAQIAELQQAVLELAESGDSPGYGADESHAHEIAALQERLATLESRVLDQERTLRHTLTMLIEWIEGDTARRAA